MKTETHLIPQEQKLPTEKGRERRRMIFIAGPTGCGKTALSLLLAEELGGEIISADSMQIYRGMNIGTAKARPEQLAKIPHHMVDIRDLDEPFSVVDYYYEAEQAITRIEGRGKVPIVVGGAGFYLHALLYGPPSGPPSVPALRQQFEAEIDIRGADEMYNRLVQIDPDYAETITPTDRQKIVRALEIISLTGGPVSQFSWRGRAPLVQGDFRCWFLCRQRDLLYQRVEERCEEMVQAGLLEEVERLLSKGLRENRSASQSIGYRQAIEYLDSRRTPADYERFMQSFKTASRRYVKRQFTWFRKEPLFKWLDADAYDIEVLVDMMVQDWRMS
ncbi:MAG: tRNA (adenosine(37)-N6)-dimethylallyltransferase MiaA [Parachlamydiales bacterium]